MLFEAVKNGSEKAIADAGSLPEHLTKAKAYRLYGRTNVDRWISEGLLDAPCSHGNVSKELFDRARLERIAASSNRLTYLPVAER